jgi:hypothetical protein
VDLSWKHDGEKATCNSNQLQMTFSGKTAAMTSPQTTTMRWRVGRMSFTRAAAGKMDRIKTIGFRRSERFAEHHL